MSSGLFKDVIYKLCVYKSYTYKEDLALNNLQGLICHKNLSTKHNKRQLKFHQALIYYDNGDDDISPGMPVMRISVQVCQ